MINFNAVDFSERRPEEVISFKFLTLSVYYGKVGEAGVGGGVSGVPWVNALGGGAPSGKVCVVCVCVCVVCIGVDLFSRLGMIGVPCEGAKRPSGGRVWEGGYPPSHGKDFFQN